VYEVDHWIFVVFALEKVNNNVYLGSLLAYGEGLNSVVASFYLFICVFVWNRIHFMLFITNVINRKQSLSNGLIIFLWTKSI